MGSLQPRSLQIFRQDLVASGCKLLGFGVFFCLILCVCVCFSVLFCGLGVFFVRLGLMQQDQKALQATKGQD